MSAIHNLLARSVKSPLSQDTPRLSKDLTELAGDLSRELLSMLWAKNGFLAFDSALHVLPIAVDAGVLGIEQWNSATLWRSAYNGLADGVLFFAQDLFGGQFAIANGEVCRFDAETGAKEGLATSLEEWARQILSDPGAETGWPLALEWRGRHGPVNRTHRLIPKQPFVLGGEFTIDNLHSVEASKAMNFYGSLATQMRDLPDGSRVSLRVVD